MARPLPAYFDTMLISVGLSAYPGAGALYNGLRFVNHSQGYILSVQAHNRLMAQFVKVYVAVVLRVDSDGRMKPLAIEWEDGRKYDITKVIDKCSAPPRHVGSSPTVRYVVDIAGNRRELYHEGNRWFVEKLIQ